MLCQNRQGMLRYFLNIYLQNSVNFDNIFRKDDNWTLDIIL